MTKATEQIKSFNRLLEQEECQCGHSNLRHVGHGKRKEGANNATFCVELFCKCSGFKAVDD